MYKKYKICNKHILNINYSGEFFFSPQNLFFIEQFPPTYIHKIKRVLHIY